MKKRAPVAIIDIGSNSGRVVVYALDEAGRLRLRAGTRAPLRLVSDVDDTRALSDEAVERALEALADFRAVALGAGARRVHAVATAAMRDAANGPALIRRIRRDLRLEVEIIDGAREAEYGVQGALRGLPVEHGLLFDLGGGSLQVSRFRDRRLLRAWSLPLGALRLSHHFLTRDPPRAGELESLVEHTRRQLEEAGIPTLRRDETLVGTGGTVRNLAKVDHHAHAYPIARVHGYTLGRRRARDIAGRLARLRLHKRDQVPGLSGERGDSIVGGAFAVLTLMEVVGAAEVLVAGRGVREGVAYHLLAPRMPSVRDTREATLRSLGARFDGWTSGTAKRRTTLAAALARALDPEASLEIHTALQQAALLLDIGRSVDFFDRHRHAAEIAVATEMDGFTHREVALMAAVMRGAGGEKVRAEHWRPLVERRDEAGLERASVLLALADDLDARCPPGGSVRVRCRLSRRVAHVSVPRLLGWRRRALDTRFRRAFGRELVVSA